MTFVGTILSIRGHLPKHPEYANEARRYASFRSWPDYMAQRPKQLVQAGFYFVGMYIMSECIDIDSTALIFNQILKQILFVYLKI